ncbi:carbohydrate-binding module family 20 domain-containing protein [Actinotalea sp. K2]|uniref:carbohydrate-binding module family 20 domain-containing protein n=1 Tax=Actinotalea sp. K2 TaxID=2939438 RepID=UPI002017CE53|nr:carbohydrate-binding module family 20 domain-containing protein [Actinotalea sp. K2]MCL3860324.1 alpha-amylase family glycosyl hydrolase [Actinotalea sp. K2]
MEPSTRRPHTRSRHRSILRSLAGTLAGVLAATALVTGAAVGAAPPASAAPPGERDVTAVLFQWTWTSVARECTSTLGPAGYAYVQVSPPQEHVRGSQWWTSYQPVSYRIESKLGNRAQFAAMVSTCRSAGVEVIADTVINHMSGAPGGGTGYAGSPFQYYSYPGIYSDADFNGCRRDIADYRNRWEVQNCNLVGLADLATGSQYVRGRIATYMNDLIALGVRGFRIDAAKHMPAADVADIVSRLSDPSVYIVQEVIGAAGEPITPAEYTGIGDVHEFNYGRQLKRVFTGGDRLANLRTFGATWGLLPSDRAGVFVDNHDTERNFETLTEADGAAYTLANVFMLAWPYGAPAVHSGYATNGDYNKGAPQSSSGAVLDATCYTNGWRCQHDWREIRNMVGFRNAAGTAATSQWWDNGSNQIAFGRGDQAYLALNGEGTALSRTFTTSLPAGVYCDVMSGDYDPTARSCSGSTVTVAANGTFSANVAARSALAIHAGAMLDGTTPPPPGDARISFGVEATTQWGRSIRVVGSTAALGTWSPAAGVALSSATYPVWRAEVAMPPGTRVEYKYVRVDGNGGVTWESGANRVATVPASGVLTLSDTWRS